MIDTKTIETTRWVLSAPNWKVTCSSKNDAVFCGRSARRAGRGVRLTEERDTFVDGERVDHRETDQTSLITL